jgi:hypothetical protein
MHPFETISKPGITRRDLLRLLVSLAAWLPAPLLLAAVSGKDIPVSLPAFGPFLDTLLPEDESPSATQLGVDTAILESAARIRKLARIIELGCAWLDRQAGIRSVDGFAALDESLRIEIIAAAEQSADRSLPKVFFKSMRQMAFQHYYSDPRSWPALAYTGPPQPHGFPGHDRAPGDLET